MKVKDVEDFNSLVEALPSLPPLIADEVQVLIDAVGHQGVFIKSLEDKVLGLQARNKNQAVAIESHQEDFRELKSLVKEVFSYMSNKPTSICVCTHADLPNSCVFCKLASVLEY